MASSSHCNCSHHSALPRIETKLFFALSKLKGSSLNLGSWLLIHFGEKGTAWFHGISFLGLEDYQDQSPLDMRNSCGFLQLLKTQLILLFQIMLDSLLKKETEGLELL